MNISKILIIFNIAGLLAALVWLYRSQELEPLITCIGLITTLIAQLYGGNENNKSVKMIQKGGKNSNNYQSNRDININQK